MFQLRRKTWQGIGVLGMLTVGLLGAGSASAATGDLSAPGCLSGDLDAGCTLTPDAAADGAGSGLDSLYSTAVSPDPLGTDVYSVSQQDDAIVHFDRDPATNAITFGECITGETETGPTGSGACAAVPAAAPFPTSNTGLDSPVATVVSPDGEDVYAIAENDDSIVHLDRNTTTGALTYVDCLTAKTEAATGLGGPCTAIAGAASNGTNTGLDFPTGIAISPGGTSVYVTATNSDSIARFTRVPATGALTYNDCISADSDVTGCTAAPTATATGDDTGLDQPFAPVVSADGDNVYVGSSDDAAVAWFDRALPGGLTWNDCATGEAPAGPAPAGNDACSIAVPSATTLVDGQSSGLARAQSLTIPPGGNQVYVGSQLDSAVYYFERDAGTGDLTVSGCLSGSQAITTLNPGTCSLIPSRTTNGDNSGLKAVQSVVVSPDGQSLYAAAFGDDAVAWFDRNPANGDINWDSCLSGETESGPAGTGACSAPSSGPGGDGSGLNALRSLAVTPDGLQLLGAAEGDLANDGGDALTFATRSNAPETNLISGPPAVTNDDTPSFAFAADELPVTFQCRIDVGTFGSCSGLVTHTSGSLSDGQHTFRVRARNDAAPPGIDPTPATRTFTVDTAPPDTSIGSGPSGPGASSSASFTFSAAGATGFECRLDGAAFAACASPRSFSGLTDGSHTFEVRAEDAAGNVDASPASRSFSIDTEGPATRITKKPRKNVKTKKKRVRTTFRFNGAGPDGSYECKRDKGRDWQRCRSPYKKRYDRGKHIFKVRAVDAVGNVDGSAAKHTWKVKRKK